MLLVGLVMGWNGNGIIPIKSSAPAQVCSYQFLETDLNWSQSRKVKNVLPAGDKAYRSALISVFYFSARHQFTLRDYGYCLR